jgi:hypothetical protein
VLECKATSSRGRVRLVAAAGTVTRGGIVAISALPVDPATLGLECPPVSRGTFSGYWTEDSPDNANGNGKRHSQDENRGNKSIQVDQSPLSA